MTETNPQTSADNRTAKKRGQWQALLLMLIVALPMLLAYGIYHTGVGMPGGTVNKGELVSPPQAIGQFAPRLADGTLWSLDDEPKHWRYVLVGTGACDSQCMANLYLTRQVHIRLNEKAARVERIYLLLDDALSPELAQHIAADHPRLRVMHADPAAFNAAMRAANIEDPVAAGRYFLMDQEGFLMMSYGAENSGNELLKDIKKMLKATYEK